MRARISIWCSINILLGCSRVRSFYIYGFYISFSVSNYMVLKEETKIVQSRNAYTQYLIIPSAVVRDSQYPFKNGGEVKITVDPIHRVMIIAPTENVSIDVSPEGVFIKVLEPASSGAKRQ